MEEMIKTITFNDVEYYILDKINYNDVVYFFFVNSSNMDDIIVRKVITENNGFYLSQLEENEFDAVMEIYVDKKNKEY